MFLVDSPWLYTLQTKYHEPRPMFGNIFMKPYFVISSYICEEQLKRICHINLGLGLNMLEVTGRKWMRHLNEYPWHADFRSKRKGSAKPGHKQDYLKNLGFCQGPIMSHSLHMQPGKCPLEFGMAKSDGQCDGQWMGKWTGNHCDHAQMLHVWLPSQTLHCFAVLFYKVATSAT